MNTLRQTGRTTKAIKEAPLNAVYVWPNGSCLNYPRRIAERLGRTDLTIISMSRLRWTTLGNLRETVIDHACSL